MSITCYIPSLFLCVSLNGKPVILHESNFHYKAYLEKVLNYGYDASGKHLPSSFVFLDSRTGDRALKSRLAMPHG